MDFYRDVLFWVFTGCFLAVFVLALKHIFRPKPDADPTFRKWAVGTLVPGVAMAVMGLFNLLFSSPVTLSATLTPPETGPQPSELVSGSYEYNEADGDGTITVKTGALSDIALGPGGWEVTLPDGLLEKSVRLEFQDLDGNWWRVPKFWPNRTSVQLAASTQTRTAEPAPQPTVTRHRSDGGLVAVLVAAEARSRAEEQQKLTFDNYARSTASKFGKPQYEWRIFLDTSPEVLGSIRYVEYELHPSFPEPLQTSAVRAKGFELRGTGWGSFETVVTVHFIDGSEQTTSYLVDLKKPWPTGRGDR